MTITLFTLKKYLLFFWAGWFSVVFATNVLEGLSAIGVVATEISLASGNFSFLQFVTNVHQTPFWLDALLFSGVILWEAVAVFFFWKSFLNYKPHVPNRQSLMIRAFFVGIALLGTFIFFDEIFVVYKEIPLENVHFIMFTAMLLSLQAMVLLPDIQKD